MKKESKKVLNLSTDCVLIRGSFQGAIYDLSRFKFSPISNQLIDFIELCCGLSMREIETLFSPKNQNRFMNMIESLEKEEIVFWCDEKMINLFPELDLKWYSPFFISTCIIDVSGGSQQNFGVIAAKLSELNCQNIQIRSFSELSFLELANVLDAFNLSSIKHLEIIVKADATLEKYKTFFKNCSPRLKLLYVHSAEHSYTEYLEKRQLIFKEEQIKSYRDYYNLNPEHFSVNIKFFTEAKSNNVFYNEKMWIDTEGNIKNSDFSTSVFGNIYTNSNLKEIVKHKAFQKSWKITKDSTLVCRDCEFRYMCPYSNVLLYDKKRKAWYNEKECGYNPYINKWVGEDGYSSPLFDD